MGLLNNIRKNFYQGVLNLVLTAGALAGFQACGGGGKGGESNASTVVSDSLTKPSVSAYAIPKIIFYGDDHSIETDDDSLRAALPNIVTQGVKGLGLELPMEFQRHIDRIGELYDSARNLPSASSEVMKLQSYLKKVNERFVGEIAHGAYDSVNALHPTLQMILEAKKNGLDALALDIPEVYDESGGKLTEKQTKHNELVNKMALEKVKTYFPQEYEKIKDIRYSALPREPQKGNAAINREFDKSVDIRGLYMLAMAYEYGKPLEIQVGQAHLWDQGRSNLNLPSMKWQYDLDVSKNGVKPLIPAGIQDSSKIIMPANKNTKVLPSAGKQR